MTDTVPSMHAEIFRHERLACTWPTHVRPRLVAAVASSGAGCTADAAVKHSTATVLVKEADHAAYWAKSRDVHKEKLSPWQ